MEIKQGLAIIKNQVSQKYIGKNHYLTGTGSLNWGGETFYYKRGLVINTLISHKPQNGKDWLIVAYHGTQWKNLQSILEFGLLPGSPDSCETFNGDKYGKGVYCSPFQQYAQLYNRGSKKKLGQKNVRLVLGLRIKNQGAIQKTTDERIWLIRNPEDVAVQDINLTFDS